MTRATNDPEGRLFEIEVAHALGGRVEGGERRKERSDAIGEDRTRRVVRCADALAARIRRDVSGVVRLVRVVGEARKGIDDADLEVVSERGTQFVSVKLGRSSQVNLYNPTFESLFEHVTGRPFAEHLGDAERIDYRREMVAIQTAERSKDIATRWVGRGAAILAAAVEGPEVEARLRKILRNRAGAYIAIAGEDPSDGIELVRAHLAPLAGPGRISITAGGVRIQVRVEGAVVAEFACYRNSGSRGNGKGLRVATWVRLVPLA